MPPPPTVRRAGLPAGGAGGIGKLLLPGLMGWGMWLIGVVLVG
ncbi:hypothetical protein [Corynebacterium lizhenjunii]|nr:hypothetical protein [Corynebacterium lizhenjunii]